MRTPIVLSTLLVSLLLALSAAPAGANAMDDRIIHDCEHSLTGELTGTYPKKALRHALRNIPTDSQEYSGCHDAIRQALLASIGDRGDDSRSAGGAGGAGGTGSGGGAAGGTTGAPAGAPPATPAHVGTEAPVQVAGTSVRPGALPSIGRDARDLPTALIALLGLLGLAALVAAATTIGPRVVARFRA